MLTTVCKVCKLRGVKELYSGEGDMPKKLTSCVKKVKAKKGAVNPWAVCVKATGLKPHRKSSGSRTKK
jgi:hypothetical protein